MRFLIGSKCFKDTHKENTPSNKTEALRKSMNVYIWAIGTLNQLFIRGSCTQINIFPENEVVNGKSTFFVIGPFFTPYSICLNIGF